MTHTTDLSPRRLKQLLKDYVRALRVAPDNLVLRLKVAFVLKELSRPAEAIATYHEVARAFAEQGRLVQAIAVCKGILEIDPQHQVTQQMLAELVERHRPSQRRPALRVQQVDGRWIAIPVPERALVSEAALSPAQEPPTGVTEVRRVAEESGTSSLDGLSLLSRADGTPVTAEGGRLRAAPVALPAGPARVTGPAAAPRPRPAGWVPGQEHTESDWHTPDGGLGPMVVGEPFVAPPELEPNVDDLPRPPVMLDFPAETKAHARGALLLDLPATGESMPLLPPAEVEVTQAASPSTLRRQVLREAADLGESGKVLVVPDDGTTRREAPPQAESPAEFERRPPQDGPTVVDHADAVPIHVGTPVPPGAAESETADVFGDDEDAVLRTLEDMPRLDTETPAAPLSIPLFSDLPRDAFVDLLAKLVVRREAPGVEIVREGELGDSFYVVSAGRVRVLKRDANGKVLEVAQLGPGAFFGEFAVLGDQRRHATVVALEETELFEISRQLLDEVSAERPEVMQTLRRFYRERMLATLLHTSPLFRPLSDQERARLLAKLCLLRFDPGAPIIEEGRRSEGLYLIVSGGAIVSARSDATGEEIELGRLSEGSYFGEISLLRGGVASATVRTSAATEVVQVPAQDFYEVMAAHPVIWQEIRNEASRRAARNAALLTGQAALP
jgi:CRP-like cAMP-binding protein